MEKSEEKNIIKIEKSNIIKDKKQVKVGIPKDIVEYFNIDPKNDVILWSIISNKKQEISLEGHLIKGGKLENENIKS